MRSRQAAIVSLDTTPSTLQRFGQGGDEELAMLSGIASRPPPKFEVECSMAFTPEEADRERARPPPGYRRRKRNRECVLMLALRKGSMMAPSAF